MMFPLLSILFIIMQTSFLVYYYTQSSQLCGPQLCELSKKIVFLQSELTSFTYHEEVFCVRCSR